MTQEVITNHVYGSFIWLISLIHMYTEFSDAMLICLIAIRSYPMWKQNKQESIPIRYVPPACQPYLFWLPQLRCQYWWGAYPEHNLDLATTPLWDTHPLGIPNFLLTDSPPTTSPVNRRTPVKTEPSRNYYCGRIKTTPTWMAEVPGLIPTDGNSLLPVSVTLWKLRIEDLWY